MANIRYPSRFDTNMPVVLFKPFRYEAPLPSEEGNPLPRKTDATDVDEITLYLPGGVQESIGAAWQPEQLLQGAGADIGQLLAGNVLNAANNSSAHGLVASAQAFSGGGIPLPSDMLIFQHVDPMTISLNFKMIPYNQEEGQNILKIISHFKKQIMPSLAENGDFFLRFPVIWDIYFDGIQGLGIEKYLSGKYRGYQLMALTSCNVSFNSGVEGAAVYRDGVPVQVELSLGFQSILKHWTTGN